jgi:oxygen-independent coproporphyrinogen-3 oxidase
MNAIARPRFDAGLVARYEARVAEEGLAIERGVELSPDDRLRRDVIQQIMCGGELGFAAIEARYGIDFTEYFADELRALEPLVADGLVSISPTGLAISGTGRLLVRSIAMVFDAHLATAVAPSRAQPRFSRTV